MDRIDCMTLIVPETRTDPTGRQVELPVIRVRDLLAPRSTEVPERTALVYLHGGPGGGAVEGWAGWQALLDGTGAELIVYDQRGGGLATPRFDCPERSDALREVLSKPRDFETAHRVVGEAIRRCHERLVSADVDLTSYNTSASVADLEDLRVSLGVEKLSIIGASYGTRLALAYLRAHPGHVESLALGGVDPLDGDGPHTPGASIERDRRLLEGAIERLVESCTEDDACESQHPALGATVVAAAARFDANPALLTVPRGPSVHDAVEPSTITVTGTEIYAGLFAAMYDTDLIPLLPTVASQLAAGDDSVLENLGPRLAPLLDGTGAFGAMISVNCADATMAEATSADNSLGRGLPEGGDASSEPGSADPGKAATIVLSGSGSYCDYWRSGGADGDGTPTDRAPDGGRSAEQDRSPAGSPPRTLIISGALDPITPAVDGRMVAARLDATYVEIPRGGHDVMFVDECARSALRAFVGSDSTVAPGCS